MITSGLLPTLDGPEIVVGQHQRFWLHLDDKQKVQRFLPQCLVLTSIEVGVSETLPQLRLDAIWWFRQSPDIKYVLLISLDMSQQTILIEKWEKDKGTVSTKYTQRNTRSRASSESDGFLEQCQRLAISVYRFTFWKDRFWQHYLWTGTHTIVASTMTTPDPTKRVITISIINPPDI